MPEGLTADALKRAIESILFVAEGAIDLKTLARLTEASEADVLAAIDLLTEESARRGVRIQRSGEAAQMVSAPENTTYIQRFLGIDENARLSPAVLATLTVIAYRQPITRGEIERILNKNADYGVQTLKLRGLITEVGRANSAGRPYLYGTTFKFLEHFGLEKPEDLPSLPELESAVRAAVAAEAAAIVAEREGADAEDEAPGEE
ncbi:MAG TPA: SMC-Scp complex subunit ScpB [Dehalococcoidia bacterium]|nr:SMC-Scp complex subunit ScpB [Dehalococcoidia bacterium]